MEFLMPVIWAFVASYFFIHVGKPVALKVGLVDIPDERKHHAGAIPLIGGMAIFFGVMTSITLFVPQSNYLNLYLLSAGMVVCLGVLDDKRDLRVSHRLIVQAFAAGVMIYGAGAYISDLGELIYGVNIHLGAFGQLVTVFAIIGAINAFNMVDGVDGLAGMLSIVTFLSMSILFALSGSSHLVFATVLIGSIAAYLRFNMEWPKRNVKKVFMGDAGSMLIGLTVVWLLVLGSQGNSPSFRPVSALWMIAIPLMDMVGVVLRRIANGDSPIRPGRDHLHHIMLSSGMKPKIVSLSISAIALLLAAIGLIGEIVEVPESIMFVGFLLVFWLYWQSIKRATAQ